MLHQGIAEQKCCKNRNLSSSRNINAVWLLCLGTNSDMSKELRKNGNTFPDYGATNDWCYQYTTLELYYKYFSGQVPKTN